MEVKQAGATSNPIPNQTAEASIATPSGLTNKDKKSKGLVFGMVFCVILAIIGIAFGIYGMVWSNRESDELANLRVQIEGQDGTITTLDTDEINISDDNSTITISDSMQEDAKVRAVVDVMQKTAAETSSNVAGIKVYDWAFPLVKVQNAKTLLPLEKSYGLYVFDGLDDISKSSSMAEAIGKRLKELGFIDNNDVSGPSYIVGGANLINPDSGIVCNITDGLPFVAGCGHVSWVSDETVALVNKLSDAYYAVEGSYPFSINLKNSTIKDSAVSPYQTLLVPVSNAMGLFYRTSPDADWQFFTATQAVLDCSDFNTQDLKNAFAGETCYDGVKDSTVQP